MWKEKEGEDRGVSQKRGSMEMGLSQLNHLRRRRW
jgi:hypothetical protein